MTGAEFFNMVKTGEYMGHTVQMEGVWSSRRLQEIVNMNKKLEGEDWWQVGDTFSSVDTVLSNMNMFNTAMGGGLIGSLVNTGHKGLQTVTGLGGLQLTAQQGSWDEEEPDDGFTPKVHDVILSFSVKVVTADCPETERWFELCRATIDWKMKRFLPQPRQFE